MPAWLDELDDDLRACVVATPTPEWIEPMNATITEARFDDAEWTFERKLDGFRFLAFVRNGEAFLLTRNQNRHRFPMIEAVLLAQGIADFVVDGEVVWGDRRTGAPRAAGDDASQYAVFDVLRLDGYDVTQLPLHARRRLLQTCFGFVDPLTLVEPLPESGVAAYERAQREGWEGVMAKRLDSVYEHKRTKTWLKMKCDREQDFVVGGFTEPRGARSGFGALLIGYYDGDDFVYAGKLGTGFDHALLDRLHALMKSMEIESPPFTAGSNLPRDGHWVTPDIVVNAVFMEWTGSGHEAKLRHPRFTGLRPDVDPRGVVRVVPS